MTDQIQTLEDRIFEAIMDESRDAWRIAPILARELYYAYQNEECLWCGGDASV